MINPLNPPLTYKPKQHQTWGNLHGSSLGLILSQVAQNAPFIVITPDLLSAQSLMDEIQFYVPTDLLQFPDWETLPYDLFSPHQDIISQRLVTLYKLPTIERGVLCLLAVGDRFDLQLENHGYSCVEQVMEHGEFALRANLVDLFAMGNREPCRIELLDDNTINSIRYFDPETQRSKLEVDKLYVLRVNLTGVLEKVEQFWEEVNQRYEQLLNLFHIFLSLNQKLVNNHLNYQLMLVVTNL